MIVRESRELQEQVEELYSFVEFVATSTDKAGRAALMFMPVRQYHPMVLSTVRDMIARNFGYNEKARGARD